MREASFMALGTAMKVVTEKNVAVYLSDIESIKMQKVRFCSLFGRMVTRHNVCPLPVGLFSVKAKYVSVGWTFI